MSSLLRLTCRATPGRRGWIKVELRDEVSTVVGGCLGPVDRPEALVLGRYRDGQLAVVAATTRLASDIAGELGALLQPPLTPHPWRLQAEGSSGRFGGFTSHGTHSEVTLLEPDLMVDVLVDTAYEHGRYRHPRRAGAAAQRSDARR